MIHSWLSARKINTFKTSGPKGKGRPLLKSTRWMIYRAESSFQPIWMRRKDFFTSPRDLVHGLGYWQCINRWRELGTVELGFAKLAPKSKKWFLILLCTELIKPNQAVQWVWSNTRQTQAAQVTGSAVKSHLCRDRGILWQSDSDKQLRAGQGLTPHSICCT